jgi:hypothetical protein
MTPETTSLVQRLKRHEFLLRAVERSAEADNIRAAIVALSQERTCSTCRSWSAGGREHPICCRPDVPVIVVMKPVAQTWGCLL